MYIQLGLLTEYVDPLSKKLRPPLQVDFIQYWKRGSLFRPKKHHDDFVRILSGDPNVACNIEIKQPAPSSSAASLLRQGELLAVRSNWQAIPTLRKTIKFEVVNHETLPGILVLIPHNETCK